MDLRYSEGRLLNPKQNHLEIRVLDVHGKLLLTGKLSEKKMNLLRLLKGALAYKGRVIIDIRNRANDSSLKIMDLSI